MRISKETTRWFKVEQDEDEAELHIRHLSLSEEQAINRKFATQKVEYADGNKPVQSHATPLGPLADALTVAAVKGWKNMFDKDGDPMACNPYNIRRAIAKIEGFADVVSEFREKLKADIEKEKEVQEKN